MLKITYKGTPDSTNVKLEGKLSGPWVDELERSWREYTRHPSGNVTIDLSGVTYIDPEGKRLLSRMVGKGVCLEGTRLMTKYVIDEIMGAGGRLRKHGS